MQALILAAGKGSRLKELTQGNTKCMIKVNGKRLIDHMLTQITRFDISRIVLVVGYEKEGLIEYLGHSYNDIPIIYIVNPDFDTTNNIYSLLLAADELKKDNTVLFESDLMLSDDVYNQLFDESNHENNFALVAKYDNWMDGTVLEINEDGLIEKFIPKDEFLYSRSSNYYKTINSYFFKKEFSEQRYIPWLKAYCESRGKSEYYENVLRVVLTVEPNAITALQITSRSLWYEIDDKIDLENCEILFSSDYERYMGRYGGYWRFPKLIDFCYLINPYFPTPKLLDEVKSNLAILYREYPSGAKTLNKLAANIFDIDSSKIQLFNGASEGIKHLFDFWPDKLVGLTIPSFNEYISVIPKDRLKLFSLENNNFCYSKEYILSCLAVVDVFILVNPDNPMGNYLTKNEVIDILNYCVMNDKILVYDESFVDFASLHEEATLISDEYLKSENLVIIKSISKSYGVAGLRLGIIASSNKNLINYLSSVVPIWGINSFAENFLQIFPKYRNEYFRAREKFIQERERFYSNLMKIRNIQVHQSHSNYFTIRLKNSTSREVSHFMVKNNILIKDLKDKLAPESTYIRVAIKERIQNDLFVDLLTQFYEN